MKLTVSIRRGDKYFIARVPELGVTTQGKTREEAKKNLKEAVQLHLESMVEYMIERGNVKFKDNKIISLKEIGLEADDLQQNSDNGGEQRTQ